jgi:raffinose/stachyose/melibiose transport system substrate-binding protein
MKLRRQCAAVMLVAGMALAGCGTPSGSNNDTNEGSSGQAAAPVKTDGFETLGDITLRVVSSETSGGPQDAMKKLSKDFEAKYPNITVKLSFRSFSEWIKAVRLNLQSSNPPDVVAGNQGYQVDGALVKAGLIRPLDDYAKAYGWESWYSPQSLQQFRWTKDGKFGEGQLWGIAQSGQSTGIFANKAKLAAAGIDPASLTSFADFQAALETLRGKLPASEPVIMLGNKDQYEALHVWGMLQGAYEPAQDVRDWIFHKAGATFDTEGNRKSLEELKAWNDKNYLGKASDYNARGENDAAILFGKGQGAFFMGGNWNAATLQEGLGEDIMFMNMPPGDSGKMTAIGATSTPFHIAAKSKQPDVAAAYMNFINGPTASQALVDTSQVPAIVNASAEPTKEFAQQIQAGWQGLVKDGGLTFYHDWSSPTMLETIGSNFQELLVGRKSPDEVIGAIQKDWEDYDAQLGG